MSDSPDRLAQLFSDIALEAGVAIMRIYESGATVRLKDDRSPVTEADEVAEAIILERLAMVLPGVPVIAEECAARGILPETADSFILVDPLDGTKEFINRNGEFTVNIALIESRRPVAGCVFAPAIGALYAGGTRALRRVGGSETEVKTRSYPKAGLTALCSRSHPDPASDAFLAGVPIADRREAGSSLKFCRVAEGVADIYPRFGPTMEWDVAAGHAVLQAAGGQVLMPDGEPFLYGKAGAGYRNASFVAWGRKPLASAVSAMSRFSRPGQAASAAAASPGAARKRAPCRVVAKQEEAVVLDGEDRGIARRRDPARDRHRIIAAEAGGVDGGIGQECCAIALIGETPGGAVPDQLVGREAENRVSRGEIGDGIIAGEGEAGDGIDGDALGQSHLGDGKPAILAGNGLLRRQQGQGAGEQRGQRGPARAGGGGTGAGGQGGHPGNGRRRERAPFWARRKIATASKKCGPLRFR